MNEDFLCRAKSDSVDVDVSKIFDNQTRNENRRRLKDSSLLSRDQGENVLRHDQIWENEISNILWQDQTQNFWKDKTNRRVQDKDLSIKKLEQSIGAFIFEADTKLRKSGGLFWLNLQLT